MPCLQIRVELDVISVQLVRMKLDIKLAINLMAHLVLMMFWLILTKVKLEHKDIRVHMQLMY